MRLGEIVRDALAFGDEIDWMDYRTQIIKKALFSEEARKTKHGYLIYERCERTDYYVEYDAQKEILAWKNECFGKTYYCHVKVWRKVMRFSKGVRTDGRYYRGSRLYLQFKPGIPGIILMMMR